MILSLIVTHFRGHLGSTEDFINPSRRDRSVRRNSSFHANRHAGCDAESEYCVCPFGDHVSNILPICVNYTAASAGAHTFSLLQREDPGGGPMAVCNVSIAAIQVRP